MKKHLLVAAVILPALATLAMAQKPDNLISVGSNVQVSKSRAGQTHYEIQLSADPRDARHLLGCSMVHSENPGEPHPSRNSVVAYVSFDGGSSWQDTLELKGGTNIWEDPACILGLDGAAYLGALGWDGISHADTPFYFSHDGGRTWKAGDDWQSGDREFITLDSTGGRFNGRLYVHSGGGARKLDEAGGFSGVTISRSLDGGMSFKTARPLITLPPAFVLGVGNGVVLSDGTFVFIFGEAKNFPAKYEQRPTEANGWLKAVTSSDGGEHFSAATVISDWYMPTEHTLVGNVPALAVDSSKGPFRDRLYATWTDSRSDRYTILLSSSSDRGKTWSQPVTVNDDEARARGPGPDDFMPVVAVNSKGVVAVQWYDRRDQPENLGWWTRLAVSLDGGESFSPSVKVSQAPFDNDKLGDPWLLLGENTGEHNRIMFHPFHFYGGDTAGLAADSGGGFHSFWIDNRTGVPQMWTAAVTVNGAAATNGAAELSDLEDVTDRVALNFSNLQYQPKLHAVTMDVSIVNRSKETIVAPLKLRLLSMHSEFSGPRAANAENGLSGPGAVWDFSPFIHGGTLKPGEQTKAKQLEFHFDSVGAIRPQPDTIYPYLPGVLTFNARVLARTCKECAGPAWHKEEK
jgi:hypothetical protein